MPAFAGSAVHTSGAASNEGWTQDHVLRMFDIPELGNQSWLMQLNQVTIGSTNIENSKAFYRTLGLKMIVESDHYLRFECPEGNSTFSIDYVDAVPDLEQVTLYFEVDDVDGTFHRLQKVGIEFEQPPTDMPWLWRESRLRDPDGHRLCLFHGGENRLNPPWRL